MKSILYISLPFTDLCYVTCVFTML